MIDGYSLAMWFGTRMIIYIAAAFGAGALFVLGAFIVRGSL